MEPSIEKQQYNRLDFVVNLVSNHEIWQVKKLDNVVLGFLKPLH